MLLLLEFFWFLGDVLYTMRQVLRKIFRVFSIITVSVYLILVGSYLIIRGRIKAPISLFKLLLAQFRTPYAGELSNIAHESGHCYIAHLPQHLISDREGSSKIVLFENDRPLFCAHFSHDDIRQKGCGLYSHWGAALFFSTSDNSSPLSNGRQYRVKEMTLSEIQALQNGTGSADEQKKAA